MDDEGLFEDLADRVAGVQRFEGILEDDLDVPAQAAEFASAQPGDVAAFEEHRPGGGLV